MKNLSFGILLMFLFTFSMESFAQKDPALSGTVATMSSLERKQLDNINSNQKRIATLQASISANLAVIREYEKKTFNYLQVASDIVRNSYEIKEAALLTSEIIQEIQNTVNVARKHPQGIIVAGIVRKQGNRATQEMISIYSYISGLALNKNTLLNSVERQKILWTVVYKLRKIRTDIQLLRFQIENFTLSYLPELLFPEQYFMTINGKIIADRIINDMKRMKH